MHRPFMHVNYIVQVDIIWAVLGLALKGACMPYNAHNFLLQSKLRMQHFCIGNVNGTAQCW